MTLNRYRNQTPAVETPVSDPAAPSPLRRDAVENRQRILDVARRLFDESGIEAVSMHRIAQAAGVGQATLYRHYINKGELCRDLMSESAERAMQELEVFWRDSEGRPALARLDQVLAGVVSFIDEKLPYLAAIRESCVGDLRTTKYNQPEYCRIQQVVADLLNEAQTEGTIPPADADFTAHAVLSAVSPDMYQYQRDERGLTQQQIVEGVRRLYT